MKEKLDKLFSYKYSYEIYCFVICLLSILTWAIMPNFGMIIIMAVGSLFLFLKNDPKMILPIVINLIFTIGSNFNSNDIPFGIIIGGTLLVIALVIYFIKNRNGFKKGKLFYPIAFFALLNIISIFWTAISPEYNNNAMYLMYLNWTLYLVIYLIIINIFSGDVKKELSIAMSFFALLLAFECIIKAFEVRNNFVNFFDIYFSLGWGVCNEAGIMLCVALPFIFYCFLTGDKIKKVLSIILFIFSVIGIIITTSRATYLVALVEIFALASYLIFKSKHRKKFVIGISSVVILLLVIVLGFGILDDIMKYVFDGGLSLNGRDELYSKALTHFTKSPLTIILGDGIANEFEFVNGGHEGNYLVGTYRMLVYHSTLFETLAINGLIGIGLLIWHFVQKYKLIFKNICSYTILLFIGFVCVDIYGFLDNTYHMYYYMIILMIILGATEISFNKKVGEENE